jgi:23S rRNA maturation mini-RNase III
LINIRKIKDRNTCEVVEHQREVTKRKTDANKKSKRKSGLSSSNNEAVEVESGIGTYDLKKKTRMKEIMKEERV